VSSEAEKFGTLLLITTYGLPEYAGIEDISTFVAVPVPVPDPFGGEVVSDVAVLLSSFEVVSDDVDEVSSTAVLVLSDCEVVSL